jgi:hypothetical protein
VVIFVTARPILQDGGGTTETLAVATVVQEDQVGRPVFGHLNINPAGIDARHCFDIPFIKIHFYFLFLQVSTHQLPCMIKILA